mgnify:CR=1 FL=1
MSRSVASWIGVSGFFRDAEAFQTLPNFLLLLVFVSLALMDVLMTVVLQIRSAMVLEQQLAMAQALEWPKEAIDSLRADGVGGVTPA